MESGDEPRTAIASWLEAVLRGGSFAAWAAHQDFAPTLSAGAGRDEAERLMVTFVIGASLLTKR